MPGLAAFETAHFTLTFPLFASKFIGELKKVERNGKEREQMSSRRRWISYDHESVFYCVIFIRGTYLMSHIFLFSRECAYATVHSRYCLKEQDEIRIQVTY